MIDMDLMRDLGALALGSRLKRLSDRLTQDGIRVYRDSGLDFQPRWFPVFYYLSRTGPSAVTDIAKGLGVTHPSVNQVAREMLTAGVIAAYKDTRDKRKRVLALTKAGKAQLPALEAVWKDIRGALQELLDETQVDFLGYLEAIERGLATRDFRQRFMDRFDPASDVVDIVSWHPRLADDFRRLNEAWILADFELEEADRLLLSNPAEYVIEPGGDILFARDVQTGEVLGTCAIIRREAGLGELAKMTVAETARGRGIGKLLAHAAVNRARDMGCSRLYLETNSRLAPALGLYRALGFVRKPSPFESDYARADVYMEMAL
ncbi:MAG TPA: bifunctional helix-turn-helix transcriptional regulator/GNAT family N-acetyltransferase [Pseudomonadales bacterium]|nr:bifunctional helix-turn-helix transcriptional regulator/GNAT family N-acetyltransferase [Pseudomonadales bacterium]